MRRVLMTGAAGRIGTAFWEEFGDRYAMRLADREIAELRERAAGQAGHEVVALDVADLAACQDACRGMETVVHLAADPSPAADFYGSLLDNNIKGVFNIFRAAKDQGCRRVVFASSVHAVVGYGSDATVAVDAPVRPLNMYGVSKCFGEATAAMFAAAEGLSGIAIRIGDYNGNYLRTAPSEEAATAFVSRRDLNQLLRRCIETEGIDFAIVHGLSNNRFKRMDLADTKRLLGYEPVDDGFDLLKELTG